MADVIATCIEVECGWRDKVSALPLRVPLWYIMSKLYSSIAKAQDRASLPSPVLKATAMVHGLSQAGRNNLGSGETASWHIQLKAFAPMIVLKHSWHRQ